MNIFAYLNRLPYISLRDFINVLFIFLLQCGLNGLTLFAQGPVFEYVKVMGGPSTDIGSSVALDVKGNIYTSGSFEGTVDFDPGSLSYVLKSNGAKDIYITKMDPSGELIWGKNIGGIKSDDGQFMSTDESGNIYITGSFQGVVDFDPGAGIYQLSSKNLDDIFILKLDTNGHFLWAFQFDATTYIGINSLALDALNNVYLTGYFNDKIDFDFGVSEYSMSPFGNEDIFILKMNTSGQFLWARQLGGRSFELVNDIAIDIEGNVLTTGQFTGTTDFDPGPDSFKLTTNGIADIFISKLNPAGNFEWAKSLGGLAEESGRTIVTDPEGNIYLAGEFHGTMDFDPSANTKTLTPKGSIDLFLLKLNSAGQFIWVNQIGNSTARSSDVSLDKNNDLYLTGIIEGITDLNPGPGIFELGAPNTFSIFTLKLHEDVLFDWAIHIEANPSDVGYNVVVDPLFNVYLVSSFTGYVDFDPGAGVKYISTNGFYDIFLHKMSQNITATKDEVNSNQILFCYPNPVYNILDIRLDTDFKGAELEIFNELGTRIYILPCANDQYQVDMSEWTSGIYFISLKNDQKVSNRVKIVKQ